MAARKFKEGFDDFGERSCGKMDGTQQQNSDQEGMSDHWFCELDDVIALLVGEEVVEYERAGVP